MKKSNYIDLFNKPFDKANDMDKKIMELVKVQKNEELLDYLREQKCNYFYLDDFMIMQMIQNFTLKDNENMDNIINCVKKQEDVHFVKKINDEVHNISKMLIERDDVTIEVIPFSKLDPKILKYIPNLETVDRIGNCFELVTDIVRNIKFNCQIVTGYIYSLTDKSKYLHAWIETNLDGKRVVIDSVFNAVFNIEGYYALTKAIKKQIINREDYVKDVKNYLINLNGCVDTLPLETYLYFRDEIMDDIKKNETIYNNYRRK